MTRHVNVKPVFFWLLFSRMSQGDQRERDHTFWYIQNYSKALNAILAWIDAQPYGSETLGTSSKEHVLSRCRAVLDPESLMLLKS
jgi:hypothetical protein